MSSSPPGWLPDPTGRYHYRWFNGTAWTADVSSGGQRFVDPFGVGVVRTSAKRPGRGVAIAGFIVAAASAAIAWLPFLFVVGGVGAVVALILSIVGRKRARSYAIAGVCISVLALGLTVLGFSLTRTMLDEFESMTDIGPNQVVIDQCESSDGLTVVDGHLRNLDDRSHDYLIRINFVVGDAMVSERYVHVDALAPNGNHAFHVAEFIDAATVQCTVSVSSPYAGW